MTENLGLPARPKIIGAALAWLIASLPSVLQAQPVTVKSVGKPVVELSEPYTSVTSVRELPDGRVILTDGLEKRLEVADFSRQRSMAIGRTGAGPGEFGSVGRLHAVGRDSTYMYDFANARFLVLDGNARPVNTIRYDAAPYEESVGFLGLDANGRRYFSVRPPGSREEGGVQAIVRVAPSTRRADTLTTITLPSGLMSGATMLGGGMLKRFTNKPFAAEDVIAIGADGSVAVARASDYRIEWFANGARRSGGPVPYEAVRITAAEKRAFLEAQITRGSITVRDNTGGQGGGARPIGSSAIPKGAMSPEALDDTGMEWPARKPPFLTRAASIDYSNRLWVKRALAHDAKQAQYDVFDSSGARVMQVSLPPRTSLVGFGKGVLFLARVDDDELVYLGKYASP